MVNSGCFRIFNGNAEERFLDFLVKTDRHVHFAELTVSKKNIASLLDITPESLSRIKKNLKKPVKSVHKKTKSKFSLKLDPDQGGIPS